LFHKAIVQSASSLLRMATPEDAPRNTHHLLAQLGVGPHNVGALLDIPAAALLQAMPKAVVAAGRVDNYRPVVDGRSLQAHPFDPAAPALSAQVPMMIGSCEDELTFAYSQAMENFSCDAVGALARVKGFLGIDEDTAKALVALYRQARPHATPGDLWVAISTDHQYRRNGVRAAELKAAQQAAPAWHYLFTWKSPVLNGLLGSPHTICIPFSFGNVDIAEGITGTGAERYALQDRMMGAWHAFMKTGNPNHDGLPPWKPYDANERPSMIFDNSCRLVNDPARAERIAISACPPYRADGSGRT
jgi:para-nitrobenzyl esterase